MDLFLSKDFVFSNSTCFFSSYYLFYFLLFLCDANFVFSTSYFVFLFLFFKKNLLFFFFLFSPFYYLFLILISIYAYLYLYVILFCSSHSCVDFFLSKDFVFSNSTCFFSSYYLFYFLLFLCDANFVFSTSYFLFLFLFFCFCSCFFFFFFFFFSVFSLLLSILNSNLYICIFVSICDPIL